MVKRKLIVPVKNSKVSSHTRSKRPRLNNGIVNSKRFPWIAATKTFNFMNDDCIVDWLERGFTRRRERSNSSEGIQETSFTDYIRQRGIEFERKIVSYIDKCICPVVKVADFYSFNGLNKTRELLKSGTPIIHSAPICHHPSRTFGIADLLVRSDYIKKLAPNTDFENLDHGSKFSHNYHYIVIDIKFCTLKLNCKGKFMLNQGSIPAYKSQLWIYNRALGAMQNYVPQQAYILGRRWSYKKQSVGYSNDKCFDRLGIVDFRDYDKKIILKARKAVRWCREVKEKGMYWNINPPSRDELYPNMCRDNSKWNAVKKKIASDLGEITQVWMCGMRNRQYAFASGVRSWKDPRANSDIFNIKGERGIIVDKMLHINRQTVVKFTPVKLTEDLYQWRQEQNEVFVDFETFGDIFYDSDDVSHQPRKNVIYHIGVGYVEGGKWCYKYFICHQPTQIEEYRIMKEFMDFLEQRDNPRIFYWHAENNFWKAACNNQFSRGDISPEEKEEIVYWNLEPDLIRSSKIIFERKSSYSWLFRLRFEKHW